MPETQKPLVEEIIPAEPKPKEESRVTIEHLDVFLDKDGGHNQHREQAFPRSLFFTILGIAAALLFGIVFAAWVLNGWGTTAGGAFPLASSSPGERALTAPLLINNSKLLTADLGDTLAARIIITNQSDAPLEHVALRIKPQGMLFDVKNLRLPYGRSDNQTLVIDETTLPLLQKVPAHATIPLSFSFGILPFVPDQLKIANDQPVVILSLTATALQNKKNLTPFTDEARIQVNSDANVVAQVRYFSPQGEQVGRGPLPPQVSNKTTYWIYFRVDNVLNALENAVLTLRFARTGVTWTGRTSTTTGSDFLFDPFLNQASWVLGSVPANRGLILAAPFGALEIALVPTTPMVGTIPVILNEMVLTGKDTFTGALIERHYGPLNADLQFDEQGKLLGVSVKP